MALAKPPAAQHSRVAKPPAADEHNRLAQQMIAALEEAERAASKPQHAQELAASCYSKLQFDFPVVGAAEVSALADLLHQCLELKGGATLGPLSCFLLTTKFVSNIVAGAKQPPHPSTAPDTPSLAWSQHAQPHPQPRPQQQQPAARAHQAMKGGAGAVPSTTAASPLQLSPAVALQAAYQRLCACVLLRYTAAALRLPEEDAWQLLACYEAPTPQAHGSEEGGSTDETAGVHEQVSRAGSSQQQQSQQNGHASLCACDPPTPTDAPVDEGGDAPESDPDDFVFEPLDAPPPTPAAGPQPPPQSNPPTTLASSASPYSPSPRTVSHSNGMSTHTSNGVSAHSAPALHARAPPAREQCWGELLPKLAALVCSDTLEALMPSEGGAGQAVAVSARPPHTAPTPQPNNDQSKDLNFQHGGGKSESVSGGEASSSGAGWSDEWRMLGNSSSSSSKPGSQWQDAKGGHSHSQHSHSQGASTGAPKAADAGGVPSGLPVLGAPDLDLWQLSDTGGALMQLLRAIGVHERARDLQPLLQACVTVLGRRLASHPEEMSKGLQELWDTLGVSSVPSLPPVVMSKHASQKTSQQAVLVPEASTALTLLVDLANSHVGSEGRAAMWRQINLHTLPVLRRCLEDVAAAREVNPYTLDAVVLVSKVVLFYLENAPGGFNVAKALLSAGVVRAMAVVLPRFGTVPGAHELRAAVLLCAAASPEVRDWVAAVPGVPQTLSGPAFQLGGWAEAEGVLWQLLQGHSVQSSQTAHSHQHHQQQQQRHQQGALLLSLLDEGRCCHSLQQLQRVRAVLELLSRARHLAGRQPLWGVHADDALRKALGAIKSMLAAPPASHTPPVEHGPPAAHVTAMNGTSGGLQGQTHPAALAVGDPGEGSVRAGSLNLGQAVCAGRGDGVQGVDDGSDSEGEWDKARGLDASALQARSMQRVGAACVSLLKGLVQEGRKMD